MLNVGDHSINVANWFTPKECESIINYAVNYGSKNIPMVGYGTGTRDYRTETRSGTLYFFENKTIAKKILYHIKKVNKQFWNLDLYNLEPMQLTVYNIEDHYTWHRDQEFAGKHNPLHDKDLIRKLSFTINLTQEGRDYTGGNFEIHDGLRHLDEMKGVKDQGNGMIFLSSLAHRVTPVTSGRRIALVGWISGPPYR